MQQVPVLYAFNRGVVSPLGLARVDQKRVALSAATMTNWIPRVLGSMSLRPGLQYIGNTASHNAARYIPFVFATDDTALVEFTASTMRVWIDDALLTRVSVSTAVTNGTFSGNITGWTDGSDSGGAIAYDATNMMKLTGDGSARAIGYQSVSVAAADQAKEHGLAVTVARGPVTFKIGTSLGDDSLVSETELDTGSYSFGFTPNTSTIVIQFLSTAAYKVQVSNCTIEASGTVTITSPYAASNLDDIRFDQSGDTVFLWAKDKQQRKIERRGTRPGARSWGISLYRVDDGPFLTQNFTPTTITSSALTGDVTLTASRPLFKSTNVGGLFKLVNQVSGVSASIAAENTFTSGLKVTGSGDNRSVTVTLTGTWVATVVLQVSTDNSTWSDVPGYTWNGNVTGPYLDGLDGQTRYYRVGVKTGGYTSGTVNATLTFTSGTLAGVARITAYSSSTSVSAQVVSDIGSTSATAIWEEGEWSDRRGWPTAGKLHEGRLWHAGKNGLWGSLSDDYFSLDEDATGDSGLISRTIGSGPVDTINWCLSLQRLILGAQGAEFSAKSSSFDTPLTPTDFSVKPISTQGSGGVDAVRMDQRALFVDRSGTRVYEILFDLQNYEYSSNDLTAIVPEFGLPGIVRVGLQRKPDTRFHCVRSDGTVMLGVRDSVEDVLAWFDVDSTGASGLIEDVVILPGEEGSSEDQVYYVVKRTISSATQRHLVKWAKETECRGTYSDDANLNKQADDFIVYSGAPSTAISGLSHLEGKDVIVWGDGKDYSPGQDSSQTTFTVASGSITLTTPVQNAVIGLPYKAQWKSSKLGIQPGPGGTQLAQSKAIQKLGVIGAYLHYKGLQFGKDFTAANMDDLPRVEDGTTVADDTVHEMYDEEEFVFPGSWDTDSRLCLQAHAPRPATILAAVIDLDLETV